MTSSIVFEAYREAYLTIERLGPALHEEALEFAKFLQEHDPQNLFRSEIRDFFLAEPQRYEFYQGGSDDSEIRFERFFRGASEYFTVPAGWFIDRAGWETRFKQTMESNYAALAEKETEEATQREAKEREMYERLKAKFG